MATYRVQRLYSLSERTYGKKWNWIKRVFKSSLRPKYIWRNFKSRLAGSVLGGLAGGAVGATIGGLAGGLIASRKSLEEEKAREEAQAQQYEFSKPDNREDASDELLERAKTDGVVQKVGDSWRIVAIKKRKLWDAHYASKEKAQAALAAYHCHH
jgi:hypothetical protein